jgi:hypothetical protein
MCRNFHYLDPWALDSTTLSCALLRLMLGGHTAAQAEAWAAQCPSWEKTPHGAISVFAIVCARPVRRDRPR